MNASRQMLLPASGLQARATRYLSTLLPPLDPAAALRLNFYLAGLLCFDGTVGERIKILAAGVVCFVVVWLSTLLPWRWRLLLYGCILLAVGVVILPLLVGVRFQLDILIKNILLVAGLVFLFVTCLSTLPPRLGRLLPSSRALLGVALLGTLVLASRGLRYIPYIPGVLATPHHSGLHP